MPLKRYDGPQQGCLFWASCACISLEGCQNWHPSSISGTVDGSTASADEFVEDLSVSDDAPQSLVDVGVLEFDEADDIPAPPLSMTTVTIDGGSECW